MRLIYLDRRKFKSSLADDGSYFINCGGGITPEDRSELLAKAEHRCFELRTKGWFNSWSKMLRDGFIHKYVMLTDEAVANIVSTLVVQQPKNVYIYSGDPIWDTKQGEELKAALEGLCKD